MILDASGKPFRAPKRLRARHEIGDAGHPDNKLFLTATGADADSTDSRERRQLMRNRARYEFRNNSFCRGAVSTIAATTIGSGPRLTIDAEDDAAAREYETRFRDWMLETGFAEKLITARISRCVDGGIFGFAKVNESLDSAIKLDFDLIEEDQIETPDLGREWARQGFDHPYPAVDGISFDRYGNPERYYKLRQHPGAEAQWPLGGRTHVAEAFASENVFYDYTAHRPNQRRGYSELAPCLFLFAEMRRIREAVAKATERGASFSAVMQTNLAPGEECAEIDTESVDGLARLDVPVDSFLQLPEGWQMGQLRPEQPTTTYGEFMDHLYKEAINCLLLPLNVGAGDSSDYNFASGRLDYQKWDKAVDIDHSQHQERRILATVWRLWLQEAELLARAGVLPAIQIRRVTWHWDEREPLDIAKHRQAIKTEMELGVFDEQDYWAKRGKTLEEGHRDLKRAQDSRRANGLPQINLAQADVSEPESEDAGQD